MHQQNHIKSHDHTFPVPLTVELVPVGDLPALLQRDDVLMVVNYSGETRIDQQDPRQVAVGLEALGNSASVEVWRGSGPVTCNRKGRICWSEDGDVLFGHLLVDERTSNDLDVLTERAYTEINAFLHAAGYPYVYMVLNVTGPSVLAGILQ